MSFEGYLTQQQLSEVRAALIAANLYKPDAQDAMLSPLLPDFRVQLPTSTVPGTQLFLLLSSLNRVHNLVNGDVPLAQFLDVAATLAAGTNAAIVIDRALQQVRYSGAIPPSAPGIPGPPADLTAAAAAAINTDVELQAQTGALDQTVSVRFLRDGIAAAASVVKLLVHRHMDGRPEYLDGDDKRLVNGTGWIIAPGLLITNHHVINARRKEGVVEPDASDGDFLLQAENTQILFDYVSRDVPESVSTGVGALLCSNKDLDFALLRLPERAPGRPPLRLRSHPIRKTAIQALGIGVNLLQHPNGNPMRLGFRNNYVVLGDDQWLSYLTDTAVGSSGSPVCDDTWVVAALHSGSRSIGNVDIEILGQKYRRENYGIPIPTIIADLQEKQPALNAEIAAGQQALS